MKKQKPAVLNISEVSSSDDESQAKPKIDKEELKKYIKDSDDESSKEIITPKSSSQKPKVKRKKIAPMVQPNKTISQQLSQKNLIPESDFRKLRKKLNLSVLIHLIIPKEKIINMWLNTMTKRFILVLPKLKTT